MVRKNSVILLFHLSLLVNYCLAHTDISNQVLLREILYAFQGIQGQVFQWDATHDNLQLKSTVTTLLYFMHYSVSKSIFTRSNYQKL